MAEITTPSHEDAETTKDDVVTPDDKQVLIDDLKKTMHDMGRIPAIIMAPIIAYVASQYEKIPPGRREKLHTIAGSLKTKGIEGLTALKTWFAENANNTAAQSNTVTSSPSTEKKGDIPSDKKETGATPVLPKIEKGKKVAKIKKEKKGNDTKTTKKKK